MRLETHSVNSFRPIHLCLVTVTLLAAVDLVAADTPDPAIIVDRLRSPKEQLRRAAVPLVEWNDGYDQEYHQALHDLIGAAVRRPALDSSLLAVQKLADCPVPEATASIIQALEATDWRLALLAVDTLGHRRDHASGIAIRRVWDRPEARKFYALRHAVVSSLGNIGGSHATEGLIDLLPQLEGQLQYEAVARLTLRTGMNYGADVTAWKEWWVSQGGHVPEVTVAENEPLPVNLPWPHALPKFFDVPIYSQRVVFVLDRSQSMLSTLNGKTRLEALQEQFTEVMQRLPESTSFGLIVFNERVETWKTTLVPATLANKSAAIQSIYSLQATGKTAVYDALEAGVQLDKNIEQVVFLTDGRPTSGKITNDAGIITAITAMNRFTRTRIDCLGIDTEGPPEELLQTISRQNFGTYTRLR